MRARAALVEEAVGSGFDVEKFVENFEVLVEATGSAKLLRELVLQLAVTGRLSSARGESAEPLLAKLRSERPKLAKAGVRIAEASGAVSDEEAPYPLPLGWRWTRLRDLGGFLGGGTPAKANEAFWNGPLPWVSPKDMKRPYIDDAEDHISMAAVEGSAVKLIPARSVLCVVRGMILAHSFPVAVTTREVTINQDMKALVLALPEISEFVLRSCQAARARVLAKVERSSHGTCRLESEAVEMLPIALPPLAEQKRIVAKVDQLMALCDELEARQTKKRETGARLTKSALEALTSAEGPEEFERAWTRVVENFGLVVDRAETVGELRRCVVCLALRGQVVPRDPTEGTGEQVLARLRSSSTTSEPEASLPPTWRWAPLGALVTDGPKNGYSPKGVEHETRVKSLTLTATTSGRFDGRYFKYIDEEIPPTSDLWLRDGDVLIQRGNTIDYVGVAAVYRGPDTTFIYPDLMMKIRLSEQMDLAFVHMAINGPVARAFIMSRASGTSGSMPKINQTTVNAIPIPIAPLKEQRRIMAKVEQLMKICDDLEAKLRRAEDRAARLVEAVVREMVA